MRTKNEKGQVLVLFVLGIVGLLAITGLAIDGGNVFADRRQAQNAADNAAFSAALERSKMCGKLPDPTQCGPNSIPDALWQAKGYGVALANGYDNNAPKPFNDNDIGNAVYIFYPPVEGQYAGQLNYVQVIIDSHISTYFAKIIGWNVLRNHVSSVVRVNDVIIEPLYAGHSVVSLAPHGPGVFLVNGNAGFKVKGSGIFVNSDYSSCTPKGAFDVGNNAGGSLDIPSITVVGEACGVSGAVVSEGKAKPYSYPPEEFPLPEIKCTFEGKLSDDKKSVTAGHWSQFPPKQAAADLVLGPGIYCIDNGLHLSGSGSLSSYHYDQADRGKWGVLLYFTDVCSGNGCDVIFNGSTQVNLAARDYAPFANLLIFAEPIPGCDPATTSCRTVTITGSNNSTYTGTVLAPDAVLNILGGSDALGLKTQLISYTVNLNGGSGTSIEYNDNQQWDTPTSPSIELMK